MLSVGFIRAPGMMLNHKLLCNKKQEFDRFSAVLLFVQRIVREVATDSDTDCILSKGVYSVPL